MNEYTQHIYSVVLFSTLPPRRLNVQQEVGPGMPMYVVWY